MGLREVESCTRSTQQPYTAEAGCYNKRYGITLKLLKALIKNARIRQSGDVAYSKLYTLSQLPKTAMAKASR